MKSALIPTHCPSCEQKLSVVNIHLCCTNDKCPERNILLILHWAVTAGMEQFAEAQIRALYNAGVIKNVRDLYKLTEKSFAGIEGFGSSKIKNALSEIERTKEMTLPSFVDKLSIEGVGEKFVNKYGIKTVEDFLNYDNSDGSAYGKNIVEFVKKNRGYIKDLLKVIVVKTPLVAIVKTNAKKICMTGGWIRKRDDLQKEIAAKGDLFIDSVSKDCNILIIDDVNSTTSKALKAKKLGVQLMSYEEYFK